MSGEHENEVEISEGETFADETSEASKTETSETEICETSVDETRETASPPGAFDDLTPHPSLASQLDPAKSAILERVVGQVRPGTRQPELEVCAQLFSAHKPLTAEEVAANLNLSAGEVERSIARLEQTLVDSPFGIFRRTVTPKGRVRPVTGFVLDLKATFRRNVATVGRPVLGPGLTETLALIALNQPISQSRLVRERGTSVYDHVKELRARDWVAKVKSGRSYELRTTPAFAAEFGLENDPELIKRALARAAGVENAVDLVSSERVAFPTEGADPSRLREEAQAFAPTPEELEARAVAEAARQRALEDLLLRQDAPEALPELPALPREDCVVSGGDAPSANRSPAQPADAPAPYEPGEGLISGGAPPTPNRIAGAMADLQVSQAPSPKPETNMSSNAEAPKDETTAPSTDDSQSTSRVAHLLSLIDDDATTDDW